MNLFGINFTALDLWLLGIAGGAVTMLVSHRLSIWRERNSRFITACITFRTAVMVELGSIHPIADTWPGNIDGHLRRVFPELQTSVSNFRPFLSWLGRWRFDRAWLRFYCAHPKSMNEQYYTHYMGFFSEGTNQVAVEISEALFHKNVETLLSFARAT